MLKYVNSMKFSDDRPVAALRQLLERHPALRIESIEPSAACGPWKPSLVVSLRVDGRRHLLVCEYKPSGQPRYARPALLELVDYIRQHAPGGVPVFIAPYLSPAVKQLCEEKGVGYLDLEGNARIAFGAVFLERVVPSKPAAEQRGLKSLFRPKSAQVLRVMLREPGRAWRVADLAEISGVSLGHVSNVRGGLIDREWAHASADGLILCEPDALLDAWRDSYVPPSGRRMQFYTPLHGTALQDAARIALEAQNGPGHAAFASFSAAQWIAPYGRTGTHYFFADEEGLRTLHAALKFVTASKGENVVVTLPKDSGLLADTIEPAPGVVCTSPVQTYLDLSAAGERGAEAAEHLRREALSWPK